jgi:hypothetical protein
MGTTSTPRALGPPLAFDRLVVDAHPGDAGADALAHHPPHRHDPAVTGVAVHDHREFDGLSDPAGDGHAFGQGRGADIGQPCVGADHPRGADKARLAPSELHDPSQRGTRRMQYREHPVLAMDQLAQPRTRRRVLLWRHARTSALFCRPLLCGPRYEVSTVPLITVATIGRLGGRAPRSVSGSVRDGASSARGDRIGQNCDHSEPGKSILKLISRNNHGHLKDKSSAGQSLPAAVLATFVALDRDARGGPEETVTQAQDPRPRICLILFPVDLRKGVDQ